MEEQEFQSVEEAKQLSKINSAQYINAEIERLFRVANDSMVERVNFGLWDRALNAVWAMMRPDATREQVKEFIRISWEIYTDEHGKKYEEGFNYDFGFNQETQSDVNRRSKQQCFLKEKTAFLRGVQNSLGRGVAYSGGIEW